MNKILVTGTGEGTLGDAVADVLSWNHSNTVIGVSKDEDDGPHTRYGCDMTFSSNLVRLRAQLLDDGHNDVTHLVNCAGVNQLNPIADFNLSQAKRTMEVNCWAPIQLTRMLMPNGLRVVCNIISNAAHVPMTHSLGYNVSKAAIEMATRQMAHELSRKTGLVIFGISPAKIEGTRMSEYIDSTVPELRGWTREQAVDYQRQAMLFGEEIDKCDAAEFIAGLVAIAEGHKHFSGTVIPYGR